MVLKLAWLLYSHLGSLQACHMYRLDIFQDLYLFVSLCVYARVRGINRITDAHARLKVRQCVRLTL